MRNTIRIATLWLGFLVLLPGVRAIAAEPEPIESFVHEFVAEHMDDAHAPGVVFIQVDRDGIVYAEGFGSADLETGRPMSVDTPLRVGSISKPVTAAVALELSARGLVDLDVPIDAYLDIDLKDGFGEPSTIRQLLQHRGGYPDAFIASHHLDGSSVVSLEEWTRALDERSLAPDVVASYSSVGYTLAGAALEAAVDESYENVARSTLFEPLGMGGATFSRAAPADIAVGYSWDGSFRPYPLDTPQLVPGAGLVATAEDIGRFMTAVLDSDSSLAPATREGLLNRVGPEPGLRGYTTGLTEWQYDHRTVLYHEGNGIGTSNRMILLPDEGVGFFTAVNGEVMVGMGDPSSQARFIRDLHEGLVSRFYPGPGAIEPGTPAMPAGEATDVVSGTYVPTRTDTGSVLRLEALVSQVDVVDTEDGIRFGSSFYVRESTGVFRTDNGGVIFLEGPDDVVYATRGGTGSYRQAMWWESAAFNLLLLGLSLVAVIAALTSGIRRAPRVVKWLMSLAGLLAIGFIGALAYGLMNLEIMETFTTTPIAIRISQVALAGALVASIALAVTVVTGRRDGIPARVMASGLVMPAAVVTLTGWAWLWSVLPV